MSERVHVGVHVGRWTITLVACRYDSPCHLCRRLILQGKPGYIGHGVIWCVQCVAQPSLHPQINAQLDAVRRARSRNEG